MNKIKVKLVKYDLTKTKNRNRKDMLVEHQSESAVTAQLERIHKGESVVKIHEIVWDEQQIKEVEAKLQAEQEEWFTGIVKFFDHEKGFGFIVPDDEIEELFFHQSACGDGVPSDTAKVEFKISEGPKGLSAIFVKAID